MSSFGRKTYRINTSALQMGDMIWTGAIVAETPKRLDSHTWFVKCLCPDSTMRAQYLCNTVSIVDTIEG